MSEIAHHHRTHRPRLWVAEALLVAGILLFGGFALISDSKLTPIDLVEGLAQMVGR